MKITDPPLSLISSKLRPQVRHQLFSFIAQFLIHKKIIFSQIQGQGLSRGSEICQICPNARTIASDRVNGSEWRFPYYEFVGPFSRSNRAGKFIKIFIPTASFIHRESCMVEAVGKKMFMNEAVAVEMKLFMNEAVYK